MIKFSFLKSLKENNNYKKILVSFDSMVDGYEIVEDKGNFELIGMNTENCKLKNFEKEVKKFIRREIYHQNPEINALTDLSLDFRLNNVYISGKKFIVKKIETNKSIKGINNITNQNIINNKIESNNTLKDKTKEQLSKPKNDTINNKNSQNKVNSKKKKKNNNKKKRKRKNRKK